MVNIDFILKNSPKKYFFKGRLYEFLEKINDLNPYNKSSKNIYFLKKGEKFICKPKKSLNAIYGIEPELIIEVEELEKFCLLYVNQKPRKNIIFLPFFCVILATLITHTFYWAYFFFFLGALVIYYLDKMQVNWLISDFKAIFSLEGEKN